MCVCRELIISNTNSLYTHAYNVVNSPDSVTSPILKSNRYSLVGAMVGVLTAA